MKPEDGPWISLPSKHHPSKVYYFNVTTGESSWEKPPKFCEPVDDSQTHLQYLAKPTTPQRTESRSYIVESLSPSTSPKKPKNVSKRASEVQQKEGGEKRNKIVLQRSRSQIKECVTVPSTCGDVKRKLTKDANESNEANSKHDRNLKNDSFHSVPKLSKLVNKEDTIDKTTVKERLESSEKQTCDSNVIRQKISHSGQYTGKVPRGRPWEPGEERLQTSEKKTCDSSVVSQKISNSGQYIEKYLRRRQWEPYKSRDTQIPNLTSERTEIMPRRFKVPDVPDVCGVASLRLERLRKQLLEERLRKSQRPQSDWLENSSEKEWQTGLLKQRNRLVEDFRHSDVPSYSSSLITRKNYFSDLGNEPLRSRRVDSFPSKSYSQVSSDLLTKSYISENYGKPYVIQDSHSKCYNDNMRLRRSYSEFIPRDPLRLQPSLDKPSSKVALKGNYSLPNFDIKAFSSSYTQCVSPAVSTSNLLQKYYVADKELKGTIVDKKKYYVSESERNVFPKTEISSLTRTKPVNQLVKYNQGLPDKPYNTAGLVKDRFHSLELGRSFPSTCISKSPAMDPLRNYERVFLQANTLRNQHPGDNSRSHKFNSNIGPFASTSNALFSGKKSNIESSRSVTTEYSYDIHQRKPIENVSYNVSSNNSTPLRSHAKDVETDGKGNEVVPSAWEWSSQGFVRDYNHKSISGSVHSAATVNNRNIHEKCIAKCKLKIKSANEEKQFKDRIGVTDESAISTLPHKSSRLVTSLPFSRSFYSEKSGINLERLSLPRKTVQLSLAKKGFGVSVSEQEKRVKDKTSNKIDPEIDYRLSCSNTDLDNTEQIKNSYISNKGLQNKLKQKSHDSKGGITKISRRVQKQVRTAAPKLIHLSSASIRNELETSLQHKKMDLNCKPADAAKFIEEEEMDWEPIEPEKVVMQVEALRKEGSFQNTVNPELENLCNMDIEVSSQWFVVLDTNVLLSHLVFLRGLRDKKDAQLGMPTLFVPWVVLQELDHLKSANKKVALQNYARRAINFIYDNLLNKHPRVGGQPKADADEYDALEPDDSILQCSLNLQKHSSKVLLLTNDRNLFNKAVVNGVECCSAPKLLQELENRCKLSASPSTSSISVLDDTKLPFHSTVETVKQCVGIVLEELLRTEMVLVYDRQWSEIVARKPPWTLNDILFCILKHWVAVFRLVLPSAARELIEKLRTFVNNEVYETSLESVENLVKTCIALMHLVSSLSYKQYVDNALKTLNALQSSLKGRTKLPTSSHVTSTFVATNKADNVLLASTTTQQYDSDAASVLSKDEQHTRSSSTGIDSRRDDNSSISASKIDTDDCLSLFASSFSEDVGNNQLSDGCIERGQELTHTYLNKIWEKIAIYCGMLCDVMGTEPRVPYQPPEPFPAVETLHQNMLFFVKCVSTLLRCMEGILLIQPSELRENNSMVLNFCNTIKETLPTWNELGEVLLPQHVLAYCTQTDTRQQLEHGKKQFEEFEAVLNRAVTFFMGQNQSFTSLPSF